MTFYLLPFKDGEHFKIGYTMSRSQGYDRIKKLNSIYGIDLKKAKVVSANDEKTIIDLEKQFKSEYSRFFGTRKFLGKDGFSEVLPIEHWEPILKEIKIKISSKDWLGLKIEDYKEPNKFELSRSFVHSLKIETVKEWRAYCKSGKKPEDIPANPHRTYLGIGWKDYGDWLGNGRVSTRFKVYRKIDEARSYVHTLKLKSQKEWFKHCKTVRIPDDIPQDPYTVYKNKGWKSWGDWLGSSNKSVKLREYLPFDEARRLVVQLQLENGKEWMQYCRSGQKPESIPSTPSRVYKGRGWISMGDWLGNKLVATQLRTFLPFLEARSFARDKNFTSKNEWQAYSKSGQRPDNIPADPEKVYKQNGWITWSDWLGYNSKETLYNSRYRSFIEARTFVQSLGLKNGDQWDEFCKTDRRPKDIPFHPERAYKNRGWIGMGDWLGSGTINLRDKEFLPYSEAVKFAQSLNLKEVKEWRIYCKSGKRPSNIPSSPEKVYLKNGWINWGEWLGTYSIAIRLKGVQPFINARKFVGSLKLTSKAQWAAYCNSGKKPEHIPSRPDVVFKNKGWDSWGDWFGTGTIAPSRRKYRSFDQAKEFVQKVKMVYDK